MSTFSYTRAQGFAVAKLLQTQSGMKVKQLQLIAHPWSSVRDASRSAGLQIAALSARL